MALLIEVLTQTVKMMVALFWIICIPFSSHPVFLYPISQQIMPGRPLMIFWFLFFGIAVCAVFLCWLLCSPKSAASPLCYCSVYWEEYGTFRSSVCLWYNYSRILKFIIYCPNHTVYLIFITFRFLSLCETKYGTLCIQLLELVHVIKYCVSKIQTAFL